MGTIHLDIDGLAVSIHCNVPELVAPLASLFPWSVRSGPLGRATELYVERAGSELIVAGWGPVHRGARLAQVLPALEVRIRTLWLNLKTCGGAAWGLHGASFLAPDGRAVVALGDSGAGKTTLLLRVLAAGGRALSDELCVWAPATGEVRGYPRGYKVIVKDGQPPGEAWAAGGMVHERNGDPCVYVDPRRLGQREPPAPVRLAALVLLERGRSGPLAEVAKWERLAAVLPVAWPPDGVIPLPDLADCVATLGASPVLRGSPEAILRRFLPEAGTASDGDVLSDAAARTDS